MVRKQKKCSGTKDNGLESFRFVMEHIRGLLGLKESEKSINKEAHIVRAHTSGCVSFFFIFSMYNVYLYRVGTNDNDMHLSLFHARDDDGS